MIPGFKAVLHDRNTMLALPVTVRAEPGVLFIETETGVLHDWTLGDIDSARAIDDGTVILQNGKLFLEVADGAFIAALERSFPKNRLLHHSFFDRIGALGCLVALVVVVLPLLALYLFALPGLAENAAQKVSPETEKQIGDGWYQSLTAEYRIDSVKTGLVQAFYDSLHYGGAYDIRITVVKEPVINAFAIPGGHIVVFDSIIGIMDAPEQLAALLAHEAAHIRLKHSMRAIFRELANNLFFTIVLGNYSDVSAIVAQHGDQLAGLSYSRSLELEADAFGLELMEHSHIPLRGLPDLFRKMNHAAGPDVEMPTFMSTHPAIEERIRIAEKMIGGSAMQADSVPARIRRIWEAL